ncbi:MAG TPA: hypothetical protein PLS12_10665 [Bacteroidales bacterium]|nr:hypothetical protein [Bacteroidales bacterium]
MMKKFILILISSFMFLTHQAQEMTEIVNQSTNKSLHILPRYFNDNRIVSNTSDIETKCELYIFSSTNGRNVLSKQLQIESSFYKVPTNSLKKGEYIYFIVENNKPIARGTFIKS